MEIEKGENAKEDGKRLANEKDKMKREKRLTRN